MMTAQEAYRAFRNYKPDLEVMSCHEYESCFVFHGVPPKFATLEKADQVFNSLFAIDKKSGGIRVFQPLDLSANERQTVKRITIFDHK